METSIPLRPLERMAATTPIAYWNDSCAVDELADPIVHGAVGSAQLRAKVWKEAGLPG